MLTQLPFGIAQLHWESCTIPAAGLACAGGAVGRVPSPGWMALIPVLLFGLAIVPRLWQAAHVFNAEKSDEAEQFVRDRVLKVLEGQAEMVIRGLRQMGTKRKLTGSKKATTRTAGSLVTASVFSR